MNVIYLQIDTPTNVKEVQRAVPIRQALVNVNTVIDHVNSDFINSYYPQQYHVNSSIVHLCTIVLR